MIDLDPSNPYANGRVIEFEDGRKKLVRDKLVITAQPGDEFYEVKPNDRLNQIAYLKWNSQVANAMNYWFVLADANNIKNPMHLEDYIGKKILIPNILRIKIEYDI